jgi:conjugal transfer/entry exclusion protein
VKGKTRNAARALVVATALAATGSAQAMLVFDPLNFVVNLGSKLALLKIQHQLASQQSGTVNFYTKNIDNSTKHIETWTNHIDQTTVNMNSTLTQHYKSVLEFNQNNYAIDADFTWIIGKGGDEVIEIPRTVEKLKKVLGGQSSDGYAAQFKTASDYETMQPADYTAETLLEGSRARKAANDALVEAVATTQGQIEADTNALKDMKEAIQKSQGTGHQLQVANALAGTQAVQLVKLRSLMLASEAARAAEAQVAADKDARAIAVSKQLNDGLSSAVAHSLAPRSTY